MIFHVSAFLNSNLVNLIVVDYSDLVKSDDYSKLAYWRAFLNVTEVGKTLGKYLQVWADVVQPYQKIQLVGHSLGGQIMSQTARWFGAGLLRLTALDPAYPMFMLPGSHLEASDGSYVDVIHTDMGHFGFFGSMGHADFYPNEGKRVQPYCQQNNVHDSQYISFPDILTLSITI